MEARLEARLNPVSRFARWRLESGGWVYSLLAGSWVALTISLADVTDWGWWIYLASAAVFLLLFEVGLGYIIAAAWGSNRQLEQEGLLDEAARLYRAKVDEESIRQQLRVTEEHLARLHSQLEAAAEQIERGSLPGG